MEMSRELEIRNKRMIEIVSEKIRRSCPGSVDLFGVGGSFCSGDYYAKSDLDLVLISKDNSAGRLDMCFILNDVGFDIDEKSF